MRNPVIAYYLVTFLISWGGLVLMLGGPDRISSQQTDFPFLPLYLITVAGPSIGGILLTGIFDGKRGYRDFISRLIKWRVKGIWYAAAVLIAPVTVFTTLLVLSLFSPAFVPGIFRAGENPVASAFGIPGGDKMTLFLFVLMLGLFNGFVEELGWTGFATPKLNMKDSVMATGVKLGIAWGLWHLLSNYIGSAAHAGAIPLPLYLLVMLFSFLPPFRIIMTWVYDHTGSLFIAILMHASLDTFWILSTPIALTGSQRVTWYIAWSIVLWGIVVAIRKVANQKKIS
jgi:membrane protease YdiL (CAAX protease family)